MLQSHPHFHPRKTSQLFTIFLLAFAMRCQPKQSIKTPMSSDDGCVRMTSRLYRIHLHIYMIASQSSIFINRSYRYTASQSNQYLLIQKTRRLAPSNHHLDQEIPLDLVTPPMDREREGLVSDWIWNTGEVGNGKSRLGLHDRHILLFRQWITYCPMIQVSFYAKDQSISLSGMPVTILTATIIRQQAAVKQTNSEQAVDTETIMNARISICMYIMHNLHHQRLGGWCHVRSMTKK